MLEHIKTVDGEALLPLPADALALQPVVVAGQPLVMQLPSAEKPIGLSLCRHFRA